VAPETVDGHDDPAGRQANRRVEVVLLTAPGS
jgi:flagellar motor protein MotB